MHHMIVGVTKAELCYFSPSIFPPLMLGRPAIKKAIWIIEVSGSHDRHDKGQSAGLQPGTADYVEVAPVQ